MTSPGSVSASVEVAVDADAAFEIFTSEMDLWQVRSPISFYDSARAIAKVCEPGVGGRIYEDYGGGDTFEIARITVWEPGKRLSWSDSHDDVSVDVWFESVGDGSSTLVRVDARVDGRGTDRGGTAAVRTIGWFGRWVARRSAGAPRSVVELPRVNLELRYARPVTAMHWLSRAFGFPLPDRLPADEAGGVPPWIETRAGDAAVMLFSDDSPGRGGAVPWVYVDDLDAHFSRAVEAGAAVVEGVHSRGYRRYVCDDLEGQRWVFCQARPTMAPVVGAI